MLIIELDINEVVLQKKQGRNNVFVIVPNFLLLLFEYIWSHYIEEIEILPSKGDKKNC